MILKGNVVKGLGKAKRFINMMDKIFYKKTKVHLHPGTLNVKLDNKYNLNVDYIIKAEEYGGSFNVQVQKCKLFEKNAYIVRSEKNINTDGDYGQEIIEIVSDVNFRECYNFIVGDKIEITIEDRS